MKKTTENNKANHEGVSLKKLNYILSADFSTRRCKGSVIKTDPAVCF